MADYALVVGVEEYETEQAKTLQGPALDALRFAIWLTTQGVPSENIRLFINKSKDWDGDLETEFAKALEAAAQLGIEHEKKPTYAALDQAWWTDLRSGAKNADTLWVYWSGHGVTFPNRRQALLCSDKHNGDPTYFHVSDFRDPLRSEAYKHFKRQRIVIDACAGHVRYEDLGIRIARTPVECDSTLEPDQVELYAVAVGKTAVAERGGSLFTRVLLKSLAEEGSWPLDIAAFHGKLSTAIRDETGSDRKLPRLRILSPRYQSDPPEMGSRAEPSKKLLAVLAECEIPFQRYQPHYLRTLGTITADPNARYAVSLPAMIDQLADLQDDETFGGYPPSLIEFLVRVTRAFPKQSGPLRDWLDQEVPDGAVATVTSMLSREESNLVLAVLVVESTLDDGFPATMNAALTDAGFSKTVRAWNQSGLKSPDELLQALGAILREAGSLARKEDVKLAVQVFANPPLLCIPYHACRIDPDEEEDDRVFGGLYPFLLRSRARLEGDAKYDFESWQAKVEALRRNRCSDIRFHVAPEWSREAGDQLAKIEGLLWIRDKFEPGAAKLQKLLSAALKRGLPLVSWRTQLPANNDWSDFEQRMHGVFGQCQSIADTPLRLKEERKSEAWARDTTLLWDDGEVPAAITPLHEEPISE